MLYDVFEQMREQPRLAGVAQEWGPLADMPVSTAPRVCWVPTVDDVGPPLPVAQAELLDGRRVEIEAIETRWAGCNLELYVPAGPEGPRTLERLINEVRVALLDVLKSKANYRLQPGRNVNRGAVSDGTLKYIQPIQVAIPIYDLIGAQVVESVGVGLRRS